MNGTLYVTSTPIGNLEDITFRAVRILKEVDLIAAEDRVHSKKLLRHYGISSLPVSYHDHNKEVQAAFLISELKKGKNVALISDAGTPCISDPGYVIVKRCRAEGIRVVPVPGVSAPPAALSVSGFPTDSYRFIGFLPTGESKRRQAIEDMVKDNVTTVFFEAPHRLEKTLRAFISIAPDSQMLLARELTKRFEQVTPGGPEEILESFQSGDPKGKIRGEITLILSKRKKAREDIDLSELTNLAMDEIRRLREKKFSTKDIAVKIAATHGISVKDAYRVCLEALSLIRR